MAKVFLRCLKHLDKKYKREHVFFTSNMLGQIVSVSTDTTSNALQELHHYKNDQGEDLTLKEKCNPRILDMLSQACEHVFHVNCPSEKHMNRREEIRSLVEQYLRGVCGKHINVDLFGSSKNGFTFHSSDLDLCLPLNTDGAKIDREILQHFANCLKNNAKFSKVKFLHNAAVPIVKFSMPADKLVGDISLNNTLGIFNTRLLSTYSQIDHRCRTLGYMFKHFIRGHCQGKCALSSYSYIMLVIYFLQQCQPPVLPVLQELCGNDEQPGEVLVDGWNAWFYEDIARIPEVWKYYGQNTSSVGELWCEILQFYKIFDWESKVVCIRRKQTLTIEEKINELENTNRENKRRWRNSFRSNVRIWIEDPFDLTHNLTGHNRSTANFLKKLLSEAHRHLETLAGQNEDPLTSHLEYLKELSHL